VWININYLAVTQLHVVATTSGPHKKQATKLYNALRKNLVENVYDQWKETGFAWEQYNPETGKGQRTQHFTGWTSLVVKIASMPEVKEGGSGGHDEL
jgi:mannosyl-oligosaccharide glucosidase